MVLRKAPMVGFGGAMAGLPVWGTKKRHIKKKRETWCVGHKWLPFSGNINVDVDNIDDNNLPPRVGKRNDGCDETKTKEEETVADSVGIHTTIKHITGRGVVDGDDDDDKGSDHDNNDDDG